MKRLPILILVGCIMQFLCACYPDNPEYISDYDVAITNASSTFNADNYTTFAFPDTIMFIYDTFQNPLAGIDTTAILNQIKENFIDYGYTEVASGETPDFYVSISAVSVTNIEFYYDNWWRYWGPYWQNFYPDFPIISPYYPWYPSGYYSYQTSSIIIDMIDYEVISGVQTLDVLWQGISNCILSNSMVYNQQRLQEKINQCFLQSPYLDKNAE